MKNFNYCLKISHVEKIVKNFVNPHKRHLPKFLNPQSLMHNLQTPNPNPQSPIPNPQSTKFVERLASMRIFSAR